MDHESGSKSPKTDVFGARYGLKADTEGVFQQADIFPETLLLA